MNTQNDSAELFTANVSPSFSLNDTSEVRGIRIANRIGGTVLWPASTSAGEVVFETAPYEGYTGTWIEAFRLTFGTASTAQADGAAVAANCVRARWSVAPVGSVTRPRVFLNWQVGQ